MSRSLRSRSIQTKKRSKKLDALAKHTNLDDPEAVKTFVATSDLNEGYKRNLIMAYKHYVKMYGLTWTKPDQSHYLFTTDNNHVSKTMIKSVSKC